MTSRVIPVEPFMLVVFGATGDLARRKLLPAMFHRDVAGQLPEAAHILGVSRGAMTSADYVAVARQAIRDHVPPNEVTDAAVQKFVDRISYVQADADGDAGWPALEEALRAFPDRVHVFYLATAPSLFGQICERLGRFGLARENARVVVEKPIGKDLASAMAVNEAIGAVRLPDRSLSGQGGGAESHGPALRQRAFRAFMERGAYRPCADHRRGEFGRGGARGLLRHGGRAAHMVQNHILQLLCLVAMEPPAMLDADAVRDEKLKVLRSLKPLDDASLCGLYTVRGQYRAGASAGGAVPGYLDELGAAASATETFVAIKAEVQNWRWAGVPFYIRTGKRLPARVSEIVITFRPIPHSVFEAAAGPIEPNRLVIRLQPDEGVKLWLMSKDPGPGGMRLRLVPLDMSFAAAFRVRNPDAYERLVLDVVRGNQTLFMRRDEVEAAWRWIDPILQVWGDSNDTPKGYTAGTWGPSAAIALIERDGRTWVDLVA